MYRPHIQKEVNSVQNKYLSPKISLHNTTRWKETENSNLYQMQLKQWEKVTENQNLNYLDKDSTRNTQYINLKKTIQGNRNIKWLTFKILSTSDIILFRISYFVQFNGGCVASPETVKDDMYVVRVYADIDITGWIVNDNLSNLQFIWTVNDTPTEIDINHLNNGIVTAVHEISTASSDEMFNLMGYKIPNKSQIYIKNHQKFLQR